MPFFSVSKCSCLTCTSLFHYGVFLSIQFADATMIEFKSSRTRWKTVSTVARKNWKKMRQYNPFLSDSIATTALTHNMISVDEVRCHRILACRFLLSFYFLLSAFLTLRAGILRPWSLKSMNTSCLWIQRTCEQSCRLVRGFTMTLRWPHTDWVSGPDPSFHLQLWLSLWLVATSLWLWPGPIIGGEWEPWDL